MGLNFGDSEDSSNKKHYELVFVVWFGFCIIFYARIWNAWL